MSKAAAEKIFRAFCRHVAMELFGKWIGLPAWHELTKIMGLYDQLGFPGAMGSLGLTHIAWDVSPNSHHKSHIAYQTMVDPGGRIFGVNKGFTRVPRVKTITRHNSHVRRVRESDVYREARHKLRNNADGTESVHKGAYLIVDEGNFQSRIPCI